MGKVIVGTDVFCERSIGFIAFSAVECSAESVKLCHGHFSAYDIIPVENGELTVKFSVFALKYVHGKADTVDGVCFRRRTHIFLPSRKGNKADRRHQRAQRRKAARSSLYVMFSLSYSLHLRLAVVSL